MGKDQKESETRLGWENQTSPTSSLEGSFGRGQVKSRAWTCLPAKASTVVGLSLPGAPGECIWKRTLICGLGGGGGE